MSKKVLIICSVIVVVFGALFFNGKGFSENALPVSESVEVSLADGDVFNLTAGYVTKIIAGKSQKMLAYNGSIPGPTIRVAQGAEVTINFTNSTDMPALLHSHGVRMENAFDGAQTVQDEMKPGESFAYRLKFPDAGVFWYHPHVKEVYGQGLGLYGAFIVTPKDTAYFPPVDRELPLFLSDVPFDGTRISITKDSKDSALMGHYGNIFLTNGEENLVLSATEGEVIRLYVINVANVRPFNFAIPNARLKIIGSDNGAYEKAFFAESVIIAPSERAIIDVYFSQSGNYELWNKTPVSTKVLGTIVVAPFVVGANTPKPSYKKEFEILQENRAVTESILPLKGYFDAVPDKKLKLTIDMTGNMMGMNHGNHMHGSMMGNGMTMGESITDGIEWEDSMVMMNQMSNTDTVTWKLVDEVTGKENMDIIWNFKQGSYEKIRIFNDPKSMHPMQHPIHFHGQRFLVIARDGVIQTNHVWKDTTLVRSGETVDILLEASNPGVWMAHCHISEHLESGMMFSFKVE